MMTSRIRSRRRNKSSVSILITSIVLIAGAYWILSNPHTLKTPLLSGSPKKQQGGFETPTLECDVCSLTLTPDNIEESLKQTPVLVEFYSPLCGACQEFAPTFHEIAAKLEPAIKVGRWNMIEGIDDGWEVDVTPTLYWVSEKGRTKYDKNELDFDSIWEWVELQKKLSES